jgi:glycosyltransferase involved in cell wall biosynthesis
MLAEDDEDLDTSTTAACTLLGGNTLSGSSAPPRQPKTVSWPDLERHSSTTKRLAAIVPYVLGTAGGQRVRIESWSRYLEQSGWIVDFYPFEDAALHRVLYRPGKPLLKGKRLFSCYIRQLRRILGGPRCDCLFIYQEAALIGPALLERFAARLGVPVVYDLDDPVFLPHHSGINGAFTLLKFSRKTHTIFRLSDHVIAINSLLANYASSFGSAVTVIPNCIDTDRYKPKARQSDGVVRLVWVGSHSNTHNLVLLQKPLRRLQSKHRAPLHVIGAGRIDLPGVEVNMIPWCESTEIGDLQACDIGLAPLVDGPWNSWKSPFKLMQYMALGLPVVTRRIGAAREMIEDGVNGFLVETEDEWHDRLELLVTDAELRGRMGRAARAAVVEKFSTQVQMPRVVSVFEDALRASAGRCGSHNVPGQPLARVVRGSPL